MEPLNGKNGWMPPGIEVKKSGFFDLPKQDSCHHREHEPPGYIHIPQGKGYRHVCPACGKESILIPTQIHY